MWVNKLLLSHVQLLLCHGFLQNPDFPTHRQSLVRWISHILPLPKARRIHLQVIFWT